jgi:hypothetical protein
MLASDSKASPAPPRPESDPPPGAGCTAKAVLPLFAAFAAFVALVYVLGCIAEHARKYD